MSKVSCFFIILAALAVSGCASVQDTFLLEKLDGQAKARALVDEGVQQYHDQLIRKGDLSKVAAVREYFTMALRDDPQNILALRYRDLVDNFRSSQLSRALKEAEAYFTQQKRRDEEDYAMSGTFRPPAAWTPRMPPRPGSSGTRRGSARSSLRDFSPRP